MLLHEKPFAHNPHYRTVFDIHTSVDLSNPWRYLVKFIINWINTKCVDNHCFDGAWLYEAGQDYDTNESILVKTISFGKDVHTNTPKYWALSMQENCQELPNVRNWFTDITISQLSQGVFRITVIINYLYKQGYFDEQQKVPSPTTPIIVQNLLRNPRIRCQIKENKISLIPTLLKVGGVPEFKHILESTERNYPILYISPDTISGNYYLNPHRMGKLLAGNAVVYYGENQNITNEVAWLLPKEYRCINGMVRVYLPAVNFNSQFDFKRHRFFPKRKILNLGVDVIENYIVRGLVRDSRNLLSSKIYYYKDIINLIREEHYNKILESGTQEDILKELEDLKIENESLNHDISQFVEELEAQLEQKSQLEDKVGSLKSDKRTLIQILKKSKTNKDRLCRDCIHHIKHLPTNLDEVIRIISELYPTKVRFTEKALKNAKRENNIDINIAWNCLVETATTLYDLYFNDETGSKDLEKNFRDNTKYDLALNEGKQTHNDPKLMKLRKDVYDGEEITTLAHVKHASKGPKLFRIYYHAHMRKRLIIVGYCGRHLDNYSTQNC